MKCCNILIKIILLALILITSRSFCQQINLGIKLESLGYVEKYIKRNSSDFQSIPLPLSGYLKGSILLKNKYEFELKGGIQIAGDPFAGPEYAILFKYNIGHNIYPLITYMKHFNFGDSRTGSGTYDSTINFWGFGIETKFTKLFSLDLIYYLPFGEKGLGYSLDFNSNDYKKITTSEIGPEIKLGFIFNILNL